MAKLFNERTEIILQTPIKNKYRSKCILLPMCAYKVLVPYPKESQLNLFQETILKLFASGAKESSWIADTLVLNEDLVEYIIDELIARNLISNRRCITKDGLDLLKNNSESYDLKTGYIFYNYVTDTYMDTFLSDNELNSVMVKYIKKDTASFFEDESIANPISIDAIIVHTENEDIYDIEPKALDILKICKRHKKRTQQLEIKDLEEYSKDTSLPKNIEKVKFLGEKKYVYVATYMYLPTDDFINRTNIQICYPFDSGTYRNILEPILNLSKKSKNSKLKLTIEGLKMDAFNMTKQEINETKKINSQINEKIENVLSNNIKNYPDIYKKLLQVENIYVDILTLSKRNIGNNRDLIQEKIKNYIIENYNLISEVLIEVAKRNDYFRDSFLTNSSKLNSNILSEIAKRCGFIDEDENFSKIFNLKRGNIKDSLESGVVKSLLAYNLIIASEYEEHPFYNLAKYIPQFITYIGDLIDLRNESDHGNDINYNFKIISAYSVKNMYIISLLLDDLTFNNKERNFNFEDNRLLDIKRIKVTENAKLEVERNYTDNLYNYRVVLKKLVSLNEEILLEGDDYPSRVCEVYESIFKILCENRLNKNAAIGIKEYKNAKKEYLKLLQEKGFNVDKLPYYSLSKLSNTFRNYRKGTLSTLFYAWFFSEKSKDDNMLTEVASEIPQLVNIIENIISVRKHNDKVDFYDEKLDYIKLNLVDSINKLIDIMFKYNIN